tara:strand:- start:609 stop:1010 length:402 start_codon:yes stop_codon:yes gene_type:complete
MRNWVEEDLFNWLQQNQYSNLVKASDPMSKWDCYDYMTNHRIELKCRRTHYDNLLLEFIKYDALRKKCDSTFETPMYINSTPKGIYRFNINKMLYLNWQMKDIRKTTEFSDNSIVSKKVTYLSINDSDILWEW